MNNFWIRGEGEIDREGFKCFEIFIIKDSFFLGIVWWYSG